MWNQGVIKIGTSLEDRISGSGLFFEDFVRGYREQVRNYYSEEFEQSPSHFPLMSQVQMTALHFNRDSLFLFTASNHDSQETIQATEEQNKVYESLLDVPKNKDREYVVDLCGIKEDQLLKILQLQELGEWAWVAMGKQNHERLNKYRYSWGSNAANNDFNSFEFSAAYKNALTPSSNYSLFDIAPIISKVNDEGFQNEFEETIKAYNAELYLASCVTAAVSLETVLKIALIRRGIPLQDKKYILDYAKLLQRQGVINEKMLHRIIAANEIRRGSAHSKSGKIEQWDAEQLIGSIRIVVEALF